MSAVVGIDLSTRAVHFAKVDEERDHAVVTRCELEGRDAWARTLTIRSMLPPAEWWDDVYLVAVEAPYGRGQTGTTAVLNRVVGAIVAALPLKLRTPSRCWIVAPHEWKNGLGIPAREKPTELDIEQRFTSFLGAEDDQDARDAACLALWARNTNAAAIAAA